MTSGRVGFLASFTVTSVAVPVLSPVGSGTGAVGAAATGAVGAAATGAAAGAAAGSWAWATNRRAVTPTISTAPIPKLTNKRRLEVIIELPFC